jgi:DNA topoisomerase-1
MIVILTEKPKVAEKIAYFLDSKAKAMKKGKVKYFKIMFKGQEALVVPAVGHLFSVAGLDKGFSYPSFNITWKPMYEVNKQSQYTKEYLTLIKEMMAQADVVVCATDYDVEGSLIGYKVAQHLFPHWRDKLMRAKFSAITRKDINEAFSSLTEMDWGNAVAGELRHELDWLYGINLSRALMSALKSVGKFKIMSIGRVQGPALALLAQREEEIAQFKPQPYWQVFVQVRGVTFQHIKQRFNSEEEALDVKRRCQKRAEVINVAEKESALPAPPAFDLTTLQTEAYNAFGFSPAHTLQLAQQLYEAGFISYPRTTSNKLPLTLPLKDIVNKILKQERYADVKPLITRKQPVQGAKDDPAHPAIHPTGEKPVNVSAQAQQLYDLITRRFLAAFADSGKRVNVSVELETGGERFKNSVSFVKRQGWPLIYHFIDFGKVPTQLFKQGEVVEVEKCEVEKKMTKPPKRYSPASIIKELEKRKLGTKATRAVILETLYKRGYIEGKKSIKVTPFGMAVYNALKKHAPLILDEHLTREFEDKMEEVMHNVEKKDEILEQGKAVLSQVLAMLKNEEKALGQSLYEGMEASNVLGKCPNCGGQIRIINYKGKRFAGCSSYPQCKTTYPLPQKGEITAVGQCETCGAPVIRLRVKRKTMEFCINPQCKSKQGDGRVSQSNS